MSNSWSRRRKPERRRGATPVEVELTVEGLGAGGDGVGVWQGAPVYAPGLLPGEAARVLLTGKRGDGRVAEVQERLTSAHDRVEAPCVHAGLCGGCSVQHLQDSAYADWKESLLDRALAARNVAPERRLPLLRVDEGRRRLRFAAIGRNDGVVLGFNGKASKRIVDIDRCIAATPDLADASGLLRPLASRLLQAGETADIEVRTATPGLDVLLVRARPLDLPEREAVAAFVAANPIARLAWRAADDDAPEIVAEPAPPTLDIGRLAIAPPPGAFLQPTAAGEAAMAMFAAVRVRDARRIADLYAGWGAFALRLADPAHVEAFEGDDAMIASLNRAAGAAGLGGFVKGVVRDLVRQPLLAADLNRFDAIVLDPPRSGAARQTAALATAGPARIVYLSCNPAALGRDARALVDGGYRFVEAMPVDQFRWTPHLEVAAYFER